MGGKRTKGRTERMDAQEEEGKQRRVGQSERREDWTIESLAKRRAGRKGGKEGWRREDRGEKRDALGEEGSRAGGEKSVRLGQYVIGFLALISVFL